METNAPKPSVLAKFGANDAAPLCAHTEEEQECLSRMNQLLKEGWRFRGIEFSGSLWKARLERDGECVELPTKRPVYLARSLFPRLKY